MKILLLILFVLFLSSTNANAALQTPKKGVAGIFYRESFIPTPTPPFSISDVNTAALQKLGVKWFYGWHAETYGFDIQSKSCAKFVPMIRYYHNIQDSYNKIQAIINLGHRGIYWLIGNEPDFVGEDSDGKYMNWLINPADPNGPRVGSDGLLENYALSIKKIKTLDPTAKIIVGGFLTISEYPTKQEPDALNWGRVLKGKITAKGVTVDGWHIHLYNCCSFNNFKLALERWKNWQNTVLGGGETWVTEYGSIENRAGIDAFMTDATNLMETSTENRYKVDRYSWFYLISGGRWTHCGLIGQNSSLPLTSLGTRYSNLPQGGLTPVYCQNPTVTPTQTPIPTNTISPTPTTSLTPTISPTPTIGTSKGWNKLSLTSSYTSSSFPTCKITLKNNTFWQSFILGNLQNKTYFLNCR